MRRFALVLLLLAAACGPFFKRRGSVPDVNELRLCVANETAGYGNLIARAGLVRFDVMPGREQCKRISDTGPSIELEAHTTGGGSLGPLRFAVRWYPAMASCWRWKLGNTRATEVDLTPCREEEMYPVAPDTVP